MLIIDNITAPTLAMKFDEKEASSVCGSSFIREVGGVWTESGGGVLEWGGGVLEWGGGWSPSMADRLLLIPVVTGAGGGDVGSIDGGPGLMAGFWSSVVC